MQELTNLELARSNGRYQLPVDNIGEVIVKLDNRNRMRFAASSFLPDIWENCAGIGRGIPSLASIIQVEYGQPELETALLAQVKKTSFCGLPQNTRQDAAWPTLVRLACNMYDGKL